MVRAAVLAALALLASAAARAQDCAVALTLAIDTSSSVSAGEFVLQQNGMAAAFRDPAVIETILSPPGAGVMASAFAWSGFQHQEVLIQWTWLGDRTSILAFADRLQAAPRRYDQWPTALGRATGFAAEMQAGNPASCRRRVVDVSGDGVNNDGVGPDWYRDRGHFDGITINGLVIRGAEPDPVHYYRTEVIHGPGAFVEIGETYAAFQEAFLRKLLRELQPPLALRQNVGDPFHP